ncbi:phosphoribosylglycinamide formyltransferase [Trichodelitschia bisporula]|uniref:Phosphoribosylglycinamide formyltransferase n=1 Tax=Trichodelitschia bisporula TaxID=703511 RepID=A0A6G1IAT4_9PEZI|nr:phosphoribosylglycinamide formyltransferase [Trichodelitschia bisporula]
MSPTTPARLTVLISGSGTNLAALITAQPTLSSTHPTSIVRVISNRKAAYGLTRASDAGIPSAYHNLASYKKRLTPESAAREAYDADLASLVLADSPDLVVCAGFMHILSPAFLRPLEEAGVRIINLHPALRGEFNGAHAIERAHAAFMAGEIQRTGVMIHYVISEVDMGEPILQVAIPLSHPDDDNIAVLEDRIHDVEHEAIVEGTRLAIEALWAAREGQNTAPSS